MLWKETVLKKIKPTEAEEKRALEFLRRIENETKKIGYHGIAVGSIAKGTWLSGDHDIDWFVLFPKETSREELEKNGLDIGKKLAKAVGGKPVVKYAEHPYTRVYVNGKKWIIDVVPCYKTDKGEKIISAVDRSPHHLAFIRENLRGNLQDECRLLKQFMKGIGVYGSDAKTSGFSGFLAELLVINYGSFENVLKAASQWQAQQSIEIHPRESGKKFEGPLVIIDPVDAGRNAAAAVSADNFVRMISASRSFLRRPSTDFFFPAKITLNSKEIANLKARGTKFIAVVFSKPNVIDDILWSQLRRTKARLSKLLEGEEEEFHIIRSFEWADETDKKNGIAVLIFEMEVWEMPRIIHIEGPPIYAKSNSENFLKKYSKPEYGPFIDGDRWKIEKEREFKNVIDLLRTFFKQKEKTLLDKGVPSSIASAVKKGVRIIENEDFWKLIRRNKELSIFLRRKYFERVWVK